MYSTFFRFFGLSENPFKSNPDPRYLFLSSRTQNSFDDLASAIRARKGLMLLTGETGTGKTTLINRLLNGLQGQTRTAFLFNPRLEVNELFDLMLAGFGISLDPHLKGSAPARLNRWLMEGYRTGMNAVLVVDEAQGLPAHVLEEIRTLLNQETPEEKMLQILLSGQPELEQKLRRPELRQIQQRISLRCQMLPLTMEEAHRYIGHRLRIAGGTDGTIFSSEAIGAAHFHSRGIPRVMNVLCEHALIHACADRIRPVPAHMVDEAARQLQFDEYKPLPVPANAGISAPTQFIETASNESKRSQYWRAATAGLAAYEGLFPEENASRTSAVEEAVAIPPKSSEEPAAPVEMRPTEARAAVRSASPARVQTPASAGRGHKASVTKSAALRQVVRDAGRDMASRAKAISIPSSVDALREGCVKACDALASVVVSPAWHRNTKSLLRWLQEPLRPVKVRGKVIRKHV